MTYFTRLSSQNISDLQVIGSDNIVISRNFTLDAVTSPCSATLNDPYFSLNLMDCDPYVQVRKLWLLSGGLVELARNNTLNSSNIHLTLRTSSIKKFVKYLLMQNFRLGIFSLYKVRKMMFIFSSLNR